MLSKRSLDGMGSSSQNLGGVFLRMAIRRADEKQGANTGQKRVSRETGRATVRESCCVKPGRFLYKGCGLLMTRDFHSESC